MKKLLAVILALSMAFGLNTLAFASSKTPSYSDVPDTHWAYSYIESCKAKGLMKGVGDNKFSPNTGLARAELAQICYTAYKSKLPNMKTEKTLSGVAADAWYRDPMYWAVANGLIKGTIKEDGGTYCYPDATADRKFVALVLYRLSGKLGVELPKTYAVKNFSDTEGLGDEYQRAITALQQAGVFPGFADGTFRPDQAISRAHIAAVIDRFTNIKGLTVSVTTDAAPAPAPAKPNSTPAAPASPPATSTASTDGFDWQGKATSYDGDLKPYAEGLGYTCSYEEKTVTAQGAMIRIITFTNSRVTIIVSPLPAGEIYSIMVNDKVSSCSTISEVKQILKKHS